MSFNYKLSLIKIFKIFILQIENSCIIKKKYQGYRNIKISNVSSKLIPTPNICMYLEAF